MRDGQGVIFWRGGDDDIFEADQTPFERSVVEENGDGECCEGGIDDFDVTRASEIISGNVQTATVLDVVDVDAALIVFWIIGCESLTDDDVRCGAEKISIAEREPRSVRWFLIRDLSRNSREAITINILIIIDF